MFKIIVASLSNSLLDGESYWLDLEIQTKDMTIKIKDVAISPIDGKRIEQATKAVNDWLKDEI